MAAVDIPDKVKNFIYLYVDSVELLEILMLLNQDAAKAWSALSIATQLRSNVTSVENRIVLLKSLGILRQNPHSNEEYFYHPNTEDLREVVTELAEVYKIRRHSVLELIFSPMKKARDFAEAFRLGRKN